MSSNRLILLFLGIIFMVIIVLSSNRIAAVLRARFGRFFPFIKTEDAAVGTARTPTPAPKGLNLNATPTPVVYKGDQTQTTTKGGVPSTEIPATGPENIIWITLVGSLLAGLTLRRGR